MTLVKLKPLHLAENLEELDKIANTDNTQVKHIKKLDVLCKVADKLFDKASLPENPPDDEIQYVYYTRYINLVKGIASNHNDIAFIDSRFGRQLSKANDCIVSIRRNLMKRYADRSSEASKKAKIQKTDKDEETERKPQSPSSACHSRVGDDLQGRRYKPVFRGIFVTAEDVYKAHQEGASFIIWDARSIEDYSKSHLKVIKNINIPGPIIKTGYSANVLSQHVPAESLSEFQKRGEYQAIVLMDWKTDKESFSYSVLSVLSTIITNWDTVEYEYPPSILLGGFMSWVDKYPMFCSDPNVYYDNYYEDFDDLLTLEGISYPSFMLMDIDAENERRLNLIIELFEALIKNSKALITNYVQCLEIMQSKEAQEALSTELTTLRETIQTYEELIERLSEDIIRLQNDFTSTIQDKEAMDRLNSLERQSSSLKGQCIDYAQKIAYQEDLPADRRQEQEDAAKKIAEYIEKKGKPTINRDLKPDRGDRVKPSTPLSPKSPPKIDRKTKPKIRDVKLSELLRDNRGFSYKGITGLANLHNTCYQNTLIQCLRHLPAVATYFLKKQYAHCLINRPTKLVKEFGDTVNRLWLSSLESFKPIEVYQKIITEVDEIYGQGAHEDIHQFFLSVMNALVEDTKYKVYTDESAAPSTKAWYTQLNWFTSFFSECFFHQIVTKQYCQVCKKRSVKYDMENVFMLSIPEEMEDRAFRLTDLMQIYIGGDAPRKIICKRCKNTIEHQRAIIKYPRIAVICIKRYKLQGCVWEKNEQPCFIPHILKISETDYKLHAIAQHIGTIAKGHYTAACHNPVDGKWYHFNDSMVTQIVNIHNHDIYKRAYLLFYEIISGKPAEI